MLLKKIAHNTVCDVNGISSLALNICTIMHVHGRLLFITAKILNLYVIYKSPQSHKTHTCTVSINLRPGSCLVLYLIVVSQRNETHHTV